MMYPFTVDPRNIPAQLSNPQLEYFILFAIIVAGKSANQTAKKLNDFLERNALDEEFGEVIVPTPFEIVRELILRGHLGLELEVSKFGQYTRIQYAIEQAVTKLDIDHPTVGALESIPGIGPKTARYVMLYADPSFQGVPLDTHILKYLKARGYGNVPTSTPPAGARYRQLEEFFQKEARDLSMSVRELDTQVWKQYSSGEARRVA